MIPIWFLIIVSSLSFFFPSEELGNKTLIILTCLFAGIAYQLVIEEKIPKYLFFNFLNIAV